MCRWIPLFLIFLSACQQFTKSSCEKTNWRKEAFLLALSGENRSEFTKLAKICQRFKVQIDRQVFNEGFDEGASQFCEKDAALEFGKSGFVYKGTCENFNENEFVRTYIYGRLQFLNQKYKKTLKKLEESEARLWRKKNEFELESNTKPTLAVKAYDELESFKAENERIKSDLEGLKNMISDLKKEAAKETPQFKI